MRDYAIRGNHDHGVAQGVPVVGEEGYRYLTRVTRPLMWDALAQDERSYLLQLPVTQRFTLDGKRFLLVHAHAARPARRIPHERPGDLGQAGASTPRPTSSASATRTCSST